MNTRRETFEKAERLCSEKIISALFESGNFLYSSLFKVVWAKSPVILPAPAQVAFSVPKKSFRLAVTRNLIKRRLREAYRRNKSILYEQLGPQKSQVVFIIILRRKTVPDYHTVENSIKEVLLKISNAAVKNDVKC